jgi:hypothetical protein
VSGIPVKRDKDKCGFVELEVIKEITDLNALFEWNYEEAIKPFNPFRDSSKKRKMTDEIMYLLNSWNSVRNSVRHSVGTSVGTSVRISVGISVWKSVWDSVGTSVENSVGNSVWNSVWDSVGTSVENSVGTSVWTSVGTWVRNSVWDSVWDSVWAYIGSLFPNIENWWYIQHECGVYPYQSVVDLWKQGIVPSFDGRLWRLHSGVRAEVIWQGEIT